jgi:hypothetical protein
MPSHTNTVAVATRVLRSTAAAYDKGRTHRVGEWDRRSVSDDVGRDYVAELIRWVDSGATWQVVARTRHGVTVALMRCDGGEEADRFTTDDQRLLAFVEDGP